MNHLTILLVVLQSLLSLSEHSSDTEVIRTASHYILNGNSMIQIDSVLLQINNPHADTEILIPYSKGDKVHIENVRIEDTHGNIIRTLKKSDIRERSSISAISLYEDTFVKYFDLKHDQYPYRIFYTSRISYAKTLKIIDIDLSRSKTPIRSAALIVDVSLADSIKYRYKHIEDHETVAMDRFKRYTWRYGYTPPKTIEIQRLDNDLKAPSVHIVPLHFKYGEPGSFATWQTFGNWVFRLNKGKDQLTPEESQQVDYMTSNATTQKQKVEILYRYLQDYTRYINVSMKLGGLQTYPASYVCQHKYGDCKALTNYLQSMLKHAGIQSYYTLVDAGEKIAGFDIHFPSQVFNHVILTVPLAGDTLFLDCTDKNIPFGYIGTFIQGRNALLIDEYNSKLVQIPSLQPDDVLCTRTITLQPDVQEINLTEVLQGYGYEFLNYAAREVDSYRIEEIIRNQHFSGKAELMEYTLNPVNREQARISLNIRYKAENIYKEYGTSLILPACPFRIKNFEPVTQRVTGIQLDYPESYRDTVRYEIPGKKISDIPGNVEIKTAFGEYRVSFDQNENGLTCVKSFSLYAGKYPIEQYGEFFRFIQTIKHIDYKNIHINSY